MATTEYRPERCVACGTVYTTFACPDCNRTAREIPREERSVATETIAMANETPDPTAQRHTAACHAKHARPDNVAALCECNRPDPTQYVFCSDCDWSGSQAIVCEFHQNAIHHAALVEALRVMLSTFDGTYKRSPACDKARAVLKAIGEDTK
jgi:hypothetical protein